MALIDKWIHSKQNATEQTETTRPELPNGFDDPEHWAYVEPDLRDDYVEQRADPDAEQARELKAERQAGAGPILRRLSRRWRTSTASGSPARFWRR